MTRNGRYKQHIPAFNDPDPLKIGDRVTQVDRAQTHYGRIAGVKQHWRTMEMREEPLYEMRYYDSQTGKLMVCPDKRCNAHEGGLVTGCAICGRNLWRNELNKIDDRDMVAFREYGLITDFEEVQ